VLRSSKLASLGPLNRYEQVLKVNCVVRHGTDVPAKCACVFVQVRVFVCRRIYTLCTVSLTVRGLVMHSALTQCLDADHVTRPRATSDCPSVSFKRCCAACCTTLGGRRVQFACWTCCGHSKRHRRCSQRTCTSWRKQDGRTKRGEYIEQRPWIKLPTALARSVKERVAARRHNHAGAKE